MSDKTKSGARENQKPEKDTEILIEKVREIEAAEREKEAVEAKNLEKENTSKILGEKMEYTPVMSDDEAKKKYGAAFTARLFNRRRVSRRRYFRLSVDSSAGTKLDLSSRIQF